jgi:hypothetical protein
MRCLTRAAPWLLVVAPVLLGLWYVHAFGVNVVFEDQGNGMLPLFEKWYDGTLRLQDFWAQHNEHRPFLPRLLMFALGLRTRWNTVAEMYVVQVLLAIELAAVMYGFSRRCPGARWLLVPVAWLVFNWRQSQNLLFGFQIAFVMANTLSITSLLCLSLLNSPEASWRNFLLALAAAIAASLSSAQGLLLWPVGMISILAVPWSRRVHGAAVWVFTGAAVWALYFRDYHMPADHPAFAFSVDYLLAILGASLVASVWWAMVLGAAIIALVFVAFLCTAKTRRWGDCSLWISCIAFELLVALQVTVSRSGFGVAQALSSRYATYSVVVVIGLYGLLSTLLDQKSVLVVGAWCAVLGLSLAGTAASLVDGVRSGRYARMAHEYQAFVFATSDSQPDGVVQMGAGPRAPEWRRGLAFLRTHGWNVFSDAELLVRYATPPGDAKVMSQPAQVALTNVHFNPQLGAWIASGWALDPSGHDTLDGVFLDVDGTPYPAFYGLPRDDVPESARGCCWASGFLRAFDRQLFTCGEHVLAIRARAKDRTAFFATSAATTFTVR